MTDASNFWEVSNKILCKIEGPDYLENKSAQNSYLVNPQVVKRKNINIYSLSIYLVFVYCFLLKC